MILEQNGKPIAKIVPIARTPNESRVPGTMKGKIKMMDNFFDDPLPSDIAKPIWNNAVNIYPAIKKSKNTTFPFYQPKHIRNRNNEARVIYCQ